MEIGELRRSKHGDQMKIVSCTNRHDILVQFQDAHAAVVHTTYGNFKRGQVKNPYKPSVCGVGYVGQGKYKTRIGERHTTAYTIWATILQRCYSEKWESMFPTYYGRATVCEEWKNFQVFAEWYESNKYEVSGRLHVDKDILFEGNTLYSPDTCAIVPQRLNMLLAGKEKVGKEYADHIRKVTQQYKNIIPDRVYTALIKRAEVIENRE